MYFTPFEVREIDGISRNLFAKSAAFLESVTIKSMLSNYDRIKTASPAHFNKLNCE